MFHVVVETTRMSPVVVGRWCRHRGRCQGRDRTGFLTSAGKRPLTDRTDAADVVGVAETGHEDVSVVKTVVVVEVAS